MQTLLYTEIVQLQRKIWHDRHIKEKQFQEGDWAFLYGSRYKDFKVKLRTRWLEPYVVERCHDNGSEKIRTIDEEAIPLLVNGHRLKMYKRPLSKQEFVESINKTMMMVEKVPNPPSSGHSKRKKQKNKDLGENLHEALESHLWVEIFMRRPKDEKNEKE